MQSGLALSPASVSRARPAVAVARVVVDEEPGGAWTVHVPGGRPERFERRGLALWFARRECSAHAPARLVVRSRTSTFTECFGDVRRTDARG